MVVISDKTSNFGINRTKRQCPICGGWFLGEHTEPCDACGGTGHVTTASDKVREQQSSRNNDYAADGYSKLTADELARIEMLKELLKGRTESIPCDLCKQTGRCFMCGGSGYRGSNACSSCAGLGVCCVCGGQKIQGIRTVPPTQEEREDIQRRIAEIVANAIKRGSGNEVQSTSSAYTPEEEDRSSRGTSMNTPDDIDEYVPSADDIDEYVPSADDIDEYVPSADVADTIAIEEEINESENDSEKSLIDQIKDFVEKHPIWAIAIVIFVIWLLKIVYDEFDSMF